MQAPPVTFSADLFKGLGKNDLELVQSLTRTISRGKNESLFPAGRPPEKVYLVLSGRLKTGILAEDGREVVSNILYPGDLLGETGLFTATQRGPFAMALDKQVSLLEFELADFRRLLMRVPALGQRVLESLGEKLAEAENRNRALLFHTARARVIQCLKKMVSREGVRVGYEVLLRNCPTHQDLADLAGTSRQTVTSILNDLRAHELLHVDRKNILVRNLDALQ